MTNKQKISDIQYLINEFYSTEKDRDGLSESAEESRKIFNQYCRDIEKDLEVLEILKHAIIVSPMTLRAIEVSTDYNMYKNICEELGCFATIKTIYSKIKEWLEND